MGVTSDDVTDAAKRINAPLKAPVEAAEVSNPPNPAILFVGDEGSGNPLRMFGLFLDTDMNKAIQFLFENL